VAGWSERTRAQALPVGSGRLALTAMFEFGFGHRVAKEERPELPPTTTCRTAGRPRSGSHEVH
jgi:hypothetical protein